MELMDGCMGGWVEDGVTNGRSVGRDLTEAVSRRSFTEENRIRSHVCSCGMYDVQSGTGTGFFRSQCHSTIAPYSFISHRCCII